jgi:hypothetical protein
MTHLRKPNEENKEATALRQIFNGDVNIEVPGLRW